MLVTIINVARSLKVGVVGGPGPVEGEHARVVHHVSPPPANNFDVVPPVRSVEPMKDIRREIERRTGAAPASGAVVPTGATQVGV